MRIDVRDCGECPMGRMEWRGGREYLACSADGRARSPLSTVPTPDWCPLRTGDVTVGLKKEATK